MKVIIKHRHKKGTEGQDAINVFVPEKQTQLVDVLRELWEREYNTWDPEPDREDSWFEEDHARIENELYVTEFIVTNLVEVSK